MIYKIIGISAILSVIYCMEFTRKMIKENIKKEQLLWQEITEKNNLRWQEINKNLYKDK
jgi:hypothetical protein